jgi:hypothetical protein
VNSLAALANLVAALENALYPVGNPTTLHISVEGNTISVQLELAVEDTPPEVSV